MSKKVKKILTIEQLLQVCQTQNFVRFSSKDSGYQLAVNIPTIFEVEDTVDEAHRGMMKLKIKMFHDGMNRNGSKVPHNSADRAMKTIPDRPLLAAIHQLDNGEWDFEAHEMELVENEDGEIEVNYIEKQIGSFSSEPAFWEHDDKVNKDFVCAFAYVPRDYTKACEINEKKKGTKNSVELAIDELSYDAKDKCLVLEEFYVSGSTLLGREKDGTEIEEGMLGSRADIAEFSTDVNSVFFSSEEKIIAMLENLDDKLSNLTISNSKEGGKETVGKFDELLAKYGKTIEDVDFEYQGLSDEELEAKFAEVFADDTDPDTSSEDNSEGEGTSDEPEVKLGAGNSDDDNDDEPDDSNSDDVVSTNQQEDDDTSQGDNKKKTNDFALSLQEKVNALYELVCSTYEEADNEWYGLTCYENPNYVIMHGYFNGRHYKQNYKVENDEYSLVGDRVQVFEQFLTQEEMDALNEMKSNYSALVEYKQNVEKAEVEEKKEELLADERFSIIKDSEEYKSLLNEKDNFSLEELETKLKLIVADYALRNADFSKFNKQKSGRMFGIPKSGNTVTSKYGGIFSDD